MEFIFLGLDHGINSIKDGGGPLVPFIMTKTDEKKQLTRMLTDQLEEGVAEAEKFLKTLDPKPKLGLIAFDGFTTFKGEKCDAIIVRSFDYSENEGLIFAQRYLFKKEGVGIEPYGNSALVGFEENILKTNDQPTETKKQKKPWWKF